MGLYRPLGLQNVEAPRMFRQSTHEGGKVASPTHRPPLQPREDPWYSFMLEAEDICFLFYVYHFCSWKV